MADEPDSKMSSSAMPTREILLAILTNQNRSASDAKLQVVIDGLRAMRESLDQMRSIELSYIGPVEPGHVFRWIEDGGYSPGFPGKDVDTSESGFESR
jgi:hypothetical protein